MVDALARSLSPRPLHCSGPQGRSPFDSSEKVRFPHTVGAAASKFADQFSGSWWRCSRESVGHFNELGGQRVGIRRQSGRPTASRKHRTRCRDPGDQSHIGLPTRLERGTCPDPHRPQRPLLDRSTSGFRGCQNVTRATSLRLTPQGLRPTEVVTAARRTQSPPTNPMRPHRNDQFERGRHARSPSALDLDLLSWISLAYKAHLVRADSPR